MKPSFSFQSYYDIFCFRILIINRRSPDNKFLPSNMHCHIYQYTVLQINFHFSTHIFLIACDYTIINLLKTCLINHETTFLFCSPYIPLYHFCCFILLNNQKFVSFIFHFNVNFCNKTKQTSFIESLLINKINNVLIILYLKKSIGKCIFTF